MLPYHIQVFEEKVNESMEEELIIALQRLLENDWSYEAEELIFKFRTKIAQTTATQSPIEPETDEQGRQVVEFIGQKKTAIARYGHDSPEFWTQSFKNMENKFNRYAHI